MKSLANDQIVIGSDGTVERYADVYGDVTQEDVQKAIELENEIKKHSRTIELSYLKLARDLSSFKGKEYFKARGYPSFQDWANSPELKGIGWRTAHNLVRVADELLPLLVELGLTDEIPPISTMYDLLPILGDDDAKEKLKKAFHDVKGLSTRDAKAVIREIRGITSGEVPNFSAKITKGTEYHSMELFVSTPDGDYYSLGKLKVKTKEWPFWEKATEFIYYGE